MIVLDGSEADASGPTLRAALSLSILTRTPFRLEKIRRGREKAGLAPDEVALVRAAQAVSSAEVAGAEARSELLTFKPRTVQGGPFEFSGHRSDGIGATILTLLPALLRAASPSTVLVEGATYHPSAPSFEFLSRSYLPIVSRMGGAVKLTLERPGFAPQGGARVRLDVTPSSLGALELEERGDLVQKRATVVSASLPPAITDRELRILRDRLNLGRDGADRSEHPEEVGVGNAIVVTFEHQNITSVFASFGGKNARAEEVAEHAIGPALRHLESRGAVSERLAEELLVPMAMGRGGVFTTSEPSAATETVVSVLRAFLGGDVEIDTGDERTWTVTMRGALV